MAVSFCGICHSVMWTGSEVSCSLAGGPAEASGWYLCFVQQPTKWQNLSLDSWLFHHAHSPYIYSHFSYMESKSVGNHSREVWPVRMSAGWTFGKLHIEVTTTPHPPSQPQGLLIYFRVESRSFKENCAAEPAIHLEMSASRSVVFFLQVLFR